MRRILGLFLLLWMASASSEPTWLNVDEGLGAAAKTHKLLLVQAYASWCRECHKQEADLQQDPQLERLIKSQFILARLNLESAHPVRFGGETLSEEQLCRKLLIPGPPVLIVFTPDGQQMGRIIGYRPPETLNGFLLKLIHKYRQFRP